MTGRKAATAIVGLVVLLNLGLLTSTIGGVHKPSRSNDSLTMRSLVERQLGTGERAVYLELREAAPESDYRIAEEAVAFQAGRVRLWLSGIARARSWQFAGPFGACALDERRLPHLAGPGRFFDWELHLRGDGAAAELLVVHGPAEGRDEGDRPLLLIVEAALLGELVCEAMPS